jgi:hypothetical protein
VYEVKARLLDMAEVMPLMFPAIETQHPPFLSDSTDNRMRFFLTPNVDFQAHDRAMTQPRRDHVSPDLPLRGALRAPVVVVRI